MFIRRCSQTRRHGPHEYFWTWRKRYLPFLRMPETYPEEWTVEYRCPGF